MVRNIVKHHNIYIFILVLALTAFITGRIYYKVQSKETKETIKETIAISEDLSYPTNNILKRFKDTSLILISGIFIITQIFNIFKIFSMPFEIGFIYSFLKSYSFKLAIIYTTLYQIIPLIITLVLIRISITISLSIIETIVFRKRITILKIKKLLKKYILIFAFLILYEIIIAIFSLNINAYLLTFL